MTSIADMGSFRLLAMGIFCLIILALVLIGAFGFSLGSVTPPSSSTTGLGSCTNYHGDSVYANGAKYIKDTDGGKKPCVGGTLNYTDSSGNYVEIPDSCTGQFFLEEYWFDIANGIVHNPNYGCQNTCQTNAKGEGYCT